LASQAPSAKRRRIGRSFSDRELPLLRDEFVHGTDYCHLDSILKKGLVARTLDIALCEQYPKDGSIPGLAKPPQILVVLDKIKMLQEGILLAQSGKEGTFTTGGQVRQIDCDDKETWVPNIDGKNRGTIRPWFFRKILDNTCGNEGNVLFLSKDSWGDPEWALSDDELPDHLVHATSAINLESIWSKGIQPHGHDNPNRLGPRNAHTDLLKGAENHINAVLPAANGQKVIEVAGLDRRPEVLITIDVKMARELGVDIRQSPDRPDHFFIKGVLPPACLTGVHANALAKVPKHLEARIVAPNAAFQTLPIIDLRLDDNVLVEQMKYACSVPGFMQVIGHDVPESLELEFLEIQKKFFNLPAATKDAIKSDDLSPVRGYFGRGAENLENVAFGEAEERIQQKNTQQELVAGAKATDNKEGLDMNGVPWSKLGNSRVCRVFAMPSRLPDDDLPEMRSIVEATSQELFKLAKRLLRLMAMALELQPDFFEAHLTNCCATHRALHYWPLPADAPAAIGCGEHTDYGLITILKQDNVGGLQVLSAVDLQWVMVPPVAGAYVVNLGDMLARWTGNYFKSTIHRVVNSSNRDRYSAPYFLEPNLSSTITKGALEPKVPDKTAEEILAEYYVASGLLKAA